MFALLCFWWSGYSQADIQVTTLDSFNTTAIGQSGITGLTASVHDSLIHMTYYYSDQDARTWLLYSIRGTASFQTDTILEILDYSKSLGSTAIQFDSIGTPWVYAGFSSNNTRYIKAYTKPDSTWIETFSLNQLGSPEQYVAAVPQGKEIGFVYCGIRIPPSSNYPIHYAAWNGTTWDVETISEASASEKNRPSMVFRDSTLYIAFAESHCPDTLITRVYVKKDSVWVIRFEDAWIGDYACESLNEISTKLGTDDAGVYLLQDVHLDEAFPQLYRFDDLTWQQSDVNIESDWVHPFFMGSTIQLDPFHSVYWINQEKTSVPGISLIRPDGESGYIALPHDTYTVFLQDMVIFKGWVHVYYFEGSYNWPWGKPVMLKEARIQISKIVDVKDLESHSGIQLAQNKPNPFQERTTISFTLPHAAAANLTVYNLLGTPIYTLVDEQLSAGKHSSSMDATNLPDGIYFYSLTTNGQRFTKSMIISH